MFFKRIEMHGFKSFAEPVVIEFDRGITCVVGPNGSGKSNISDAIRWVLGEQSPRLLRGGKMEDVIFAGTTNRRSRGMAEVTLVIDNSSKFLPVDFAEVAITRRMYRSGESEYAINNNPCRMRDIRDLLADTGIGVDGYSLIGQGKISEIISNKKDSIREIFEETAGVVGYKTKKNEAERKLYNTYSNMERVQDIVLEIENRIDGLADDSKRAKEYLGLKDRYKELEVNITVQSIEDIEEKTIIFREDLAEIKENLEILNGKKENSEYEMSTLKDEISKMEVELEIKSEKLREIEIQLNDRIGENTIGRERLRAIENNKFRIKREVSDLNDKLGDELKTIEDLSTKKEELLKKYEKEFAEVGQVEKEENERKEDIVKLQSEIEERKQDVFALKGKINIAMNEKSNLESLGESVEKDYAQAGLEEKEYEISNLEEQIGEKESLYEEVKGKGEKLEKELKKEKQILDNLKIEFEKKLKDAQENFVNIEKFTERMKTLEALEENYEGYNYGVKFILNKKIQGIDDVVTNLIKVPKGFEKAIEIVLGASLQHIVCKDTDIAKKSIELLKKNKAGRVTFLPSSAIKGRKINKDAQIERVEGFIGYAQECVEFDLQYENIFSQLLGGTVIAENIDCAIRMQQISGKYRYVTLEGDIVSSTGYMSGGAYKNKGNNLLERKKDINQLKEKILELKKKREQFENEKISLSKEILKLQEKESEKNIEAIELKSFETKILNELESLKIKLEFSLREDEKRKKSLEELESNMREIEKSIKQKENDIKDFEKNIEKLEISLKEKTAEFDHLIQIDKEKNNQVVEMRIKTNQVKGEVSVIDSLIARNREIVLEIQNNIAEKKKQEENLKHDETAIKQGIDSRNEQVTKYTLEKNSLIHEINIEKTKVSTEKRKLEESIEQRENNLDKINKLGEEKYQLDIKLAKFDAQLENLKNKIWDEFEISYQEAVELRNDKISISSAIKENREIKNRIKALGDVNVGAIKEYDEVKNRYEFLIKQREDIEASISQLKEIIDEMDDIIKDKFKRSFDSIGEHFEGIFKEFFGGGSAKLEIDNIDDPMNSVIDITAQPPGKQLKNINLLSGGEKTMTAIALMFAILKTKPTPCCILDEVEAALDDNNIHIFANYLKKFQNIQFTLITHQKTTMEHADVMYGVTMPERGVSKIFSLNMGAELPMS